MLGSYFNPCNAIDSHNMVCQSDLSLNKYWVKHSGYFRLEITSALDVGSPDAKLLFCNGVSEQIRDKKLSMRNEKNIKFYNYFNNPFPVDCGSPDLNLPSIPIDDISIPNKRVRYTPDYPPDDISVASGNSVSNFTTPSDSLQVILLNYIPISTNRNIMRDKPVHAMDKI